MKKKIKKSKVAKKIPQLKVSKITSYRVDYYDFEVFVKKVYRKDFRFALDQESSNDTSHEFWVSKKKLDEYDQERMDEFLGDSEDLLHGGPYADVILNDLCHKGLIKPGHYIVRVCW